MTKRPTNPLENPVPSRLEDHVNRALKAGASLFLPAPVMEYLQWIVGDPAQERRDDFLQALYAKLRDLEGEVNEALEPEKLRSNPAFTATVLQAVQIASRTAQDDKLEMLRNAIANAAILDLDENLRQMYLQFLDRLTGMHIALLAFLDDPTANQAVRAELQHLSVGGLSHLIPIAVPALRGQDDLARVLTGDLDTMGLTTGIGSGTMTSHGLKASRTSKLGKGFLKFIADPESGAIPGVDR